MWYTLFHLAGVEYIGETRRSLTQHIEEYVKAIDYNHPERSAAAKHGLRASHVPLRDNVNVLAASQNCYRRCGTLNKRVSL